MKLKYLILLLFFLPIETFSQNTVGKIILKDGVAPGFTLFSAHTNSYLINNCGEIVNIWESNFPPGNAVYLLPNGNLLRAGKEEGKSDIIFGGQGGIVELFDWDGNIIWSHSFNNNSIRQHHDVYPMPNGNILVLVAESWSKDDAVANGRDGSLMTEDRLYNEKILEIKPIGINQYSLVWEWSVKDHIVQDFDNTKDNFGVVSDNPQKLDVNFLNGGSGNASWLHVNSIQYNDKLDQIIISSRNLSEFWIIDHSTTTIESQGSNGGKYGKGGDFLYRWGNPKSYKIGDDSDRILYGQHSPNFIYENGEFTDNVIVFNNGRDRSPIFSDVLKIDLPVDDDGFYTYSPNTIFLPEEAYYNYSDMTETPSEFYSGILSSAQVLPNNNILICEGASGNIFEINEEKEVVWQYINPVDNSDGKIFSQGEQVLRNNTFRATKYNLDYAAFNGRDMSGNETIEPSSNASSCNSLSSPNFNLDEITLFPNPTNSGEIFIKGSFSIDKIEVINVLGKLVIEINNSPSKLNINTLNKGIYFLRIHSGNSITIKKVVFN